ncbi:hydrolase [Capsulimonas corticalis]|uniref:Hydrolase n=1 Tax=Capsulimonas corticalis TaxID=2219043 RepID=A0A402CZ47_9BACT|nr:hydrolase [Capsulimonas corticalis]BDI29539.1 hydrolase [Capsulimonas corticalis]
MNDAKLTLDPKTTALVLIDLQKGVVSRDVAPYSSQDVVAQSARLAERFRELESTVALVHVSFHPDGRDRLTAPVDESMASASPPPGWDEFVPELSPRPSDLVVTKHQWGAFYETGLDLQLRRRGVQTIVLGGLVTNFGVESTARDAYERGYAVVLAEDAMASMTAEAHEFAVKSVFPRLGRVRSVQNILDALG